VVAGLAAADGVSLRAADGRYLRHRGFRLRLDAADGSALHKKDSTFLVRPAAEGAFRLESVNYP
jgi:hypothetical protein